MAERPIILFPEPQLADRDKRRKNPMPIMNKPTFRKQYNRLQPAFNVLKDAFEKKENTDTERTGWYESRICSCF